MLVLVFASLTCLPMLCEFMGWQTALGAGENRVLAPLPGAPRSMIEAMAYPEALSAYLSDHYGLRSRLVSWDGRLRFGLFSEFASDQVTMGRHGRLFFISHTAGHPYSLTDLICGTAITPAQDAQAATGMARLIDESRTVTSAAFYVAVPTTPVIDHADLPAWLARRCDRTQAFVPRLAHELSSQRPDIAGHLVYPLDPLKATRLPYPIWNFHWSGVGARAVTEYVGGTLLGLPRRAPLMDGTVAEPSDLSQFTPGLQHVDEVPFPDHAKAGIDFCYGGGGACGPQFAEFGNAINEITRSKWRSGHGPYVLVISDSFGRMAAQYLGEYFGTVLHLNIAFERMRPGELESLAAEIAKQGRPDALLFVFHDAAASDGGGLAGPFAVIAAAFSP